MKSSSSSFSFKPTSVLEAYAASGTCRDVAPMSYLYSSSSLDDVVEMVCTLTFMRTMFSFEEIVPEDDFAVAVASDEAVWRDYMAEYVTFVCMVNPAFPPSRFEEVFSGSSIYYSFHWRNLLEDFALYGRGWLDHFPGLKFFR